MIATRSRLAGIFATLLVATLLSACLRVQPVQNVSDERFPAVVSAKLSLDEIADAISVAGAGRQDSWVFTRQDSNLLTGELNVRQHYAKVRIPFDISKFSIIYEDSRVLKYDGASIHRNYNKWVELLRQDILKSVSAAAARK